MPSVSLPPPIRNFKLCYVTDRRALVGSAKEQTGRLHDKIAAAACAGVDWIQIREKDMTGRQLIELVRNTMGRVPATCRVLVNDRLDVACAAGAAGVHLSQQSLRVADARRFLKERKLPKDFLVGVSTHSLEAAQTAEADGADYVIFGPVFPTPSKLAYGSPQGVEKLGQVCRSVSIPVLAIGGITAENAPQCVTVGASGVAAIRLFQEADDFAAIVNSFRI